ncbi:MAG TPA: hypothetical protein VH120_09295 [Gemmataceae bacterium]|jgi:hypothetical protein|nr:hypothetical protein [Gemmataceae bacterium]
MSKQHQPAPTPAGNRPQAGPPHGDSTETPHASREDGFQEQDPQRRLGDFESAGEHSRQQPSALNDGTTHSK